MKKAIALQLADAIESGHYIRGRGINREYDAETKITKWCIGGVLINLFAQAHPELAAKEKHIGQFMGCSGSIPPAVRRWAGLYECDMVVRTEHRNEFRIDGHEYRGLQHANDVTYGGTWSSQPLKYKVSWKQIAKWLRTGKNHELI